MDKPTIKVTSVQHVPGGKCSGADHVFPARHAHENESCACGKVVYSRAIAALEESQRRVE